jgi:hypothetical protein
VVGSNGFAAKAKGRQWNADHLVSLRVLGDLCVSAAKDLPREGTGQLRTSDRQDRPGAQLGE